MKKLEKDKIQDLLALTPLQEGMLFHYLKNPGSDYYFEQLSLEISGRIDVEIFEKAWNLVIETNEMLRTVFRWEKLEKPIQIILKEHQGNVIFYDWSDKNSRQKKTALEAIKDKDRRETFDLHQVPFRVILCKLDEKKYEVVISNHHILYDGWSNGIILKEFFMAYHELCQGGGSLKLPVKPPFKEFIKGIRGQDRNKQEQFWKNYLAGVESTTELPLKKRVEETTRAEDYSIILEEDLRGQLDLFIKNHRLTLASVFYTAWGILLQKYCNSEDVIFGTTVSGRSAGRKGIEEMVGLFINTLPLRVQSAPGVKKIDILAGVEKVLRVRKEFENTPLVDIGSYSPVGGSAPLFDTLVVIENYPLDSRLLPKDSLLSINSYSTAEMPHYDLTVGIMPFKEIEIKFSFKQELFAKETIKNVAGHFNVILRNTIENPEAAIYQLEIMSSEEKKRILVEFNNTAAEYPADKTIHRLFAEQVERTPTHIALVGPKFQIPNPKSQTHITYRELDEQSNRLADLLIEKGVLADIIVGIMVERSVEMIVGILGILKSGGAYLPIDPEYPQERIDFMLKDSRAGVLITSSVLSDKHEKLKIVNSQLSIVNYQRQKNRTSVAKKNHLHLSPALVTSLAYVIYTSGSTGKPKGVLVRHDGVTNAVSWRKTEYPLGVNDNVLQLFSFAFDGFVTSFFTPVISGSGVIFLSDEESMDIGAVKKAIVSRRITHFISVPSIYRSLLELCQTGDLQNLRIITLAGEAVNSVLLEKSRRLNPRLRVMIEYGATENTVVATIYRDARPGTGVLIGKPVANTKIYILDRSGHLSPIGINGEISIVGIGVARGYLNNPELTAEKFDAFDNRSYKSYRTYISQKRYKTGDLGRWLPDGNIEFLGRIDHQVKIRGFRIELGEIESRLLNYPGIKEAVVLSREEERGDKYICAYVVIAREYGMSAIREYLSGELPDYMIPSYFVRMEKIPLTSNGKIDRKAFPVPGIKAGDNYEAPRDRIEKKLVEIWSGVLGIEKEKIGINDNFFHLGGHSLKAMILVSKLHKLFEAIVPVVEIFKNPRIRELAGYIKEAVSRKYEQVELAEKKQYYALSSAQQRLYFLQQMDKDGTAYNIAAVWLVEGIIDKPVLEQSFRRLIRGHESLRTSFTVIAEEPVQIIHEHVEFQVENYILQNTKYKQIPNYKSQITNQIESFIRPFDLSKAPLLRVGLVKLEAEKQLLLVDMHHITADGMSCQVLVQDFSALYAGKELPGIKVRYKDYAEGQNRERVSKKILEQGEYWKKEYEGEIPALELPTDYARPAVQGFAGNSINFEINSETSGALKALALETGATLYIVLLALYTIFLAKLSSQEDIVIGTPVAGRKHADLEKIIGMFVNTLALRNYPWGEKGFRAFLEEVKETALKGFENQEYQYEDLVEQISVHRDAGRNPLFDTMFVLQNSGPQEIEIPGLKLVPYEYENKTSKFDLTLIVVEVERKLHLTFEYSTKLFIQETLERLIAYFKNLIRGVIENHNQRISDLEILTEEEKNRILFEFNDTGAGYPKDKTLHELFEEQARRTPGIIALTGVEPRVIHITYRELQERSDRLALVLKERSVRPGDIVAILVKRSIEMIVAILGILKSGAAYLPLNPEQPEVRTHFMMKDSGAKFLVTTCNTAIEGEQVRRWEGEKNLEIVFLDAPSSLTFDLPDFLTSQLPNFPFSPATSHRPPATSLAYVIYTSGSTGNPKGVPVAHTNFSPLIHWGYRHLGIKEKDRVIQNLSYYFDWSVWEIFITLTSGASLYMVPGDIVPDADRYVDFINRYRITVLHITPTHFQSLSLCGRKLSTLSHLCLGAEKLTYDLVKRSYGLVDQGCRVFNMYGPTEATIISSVLEIPGPNWGSETTRSSVPIGRPVGNTTLLVLDKYKQPCPVNIIGELYIGGAGLAGGYLNNPELTCDKFDHDLKDLWDYHDKTLLRGVQGGGFFTGDRCRLQVKVGNRRATKKEANFNRSGLPAPPPGRRRLYKTGDLARWLPDGNIEFIGRIDHQVKIRGFRVEPGEIESRLLNYPGIKEVVVLAREEESGDKYLCAYAVSAREYVISELREFLAKELPDYMIPSYVVQLQKIPLTPNGKIDRRALPKPGLKAGESYTAPRDEIERKLAAIWSEVLGRDELPTSQLQRSPGIDDNFFYLGGHSLKASLLVARIHKKFNVNIPLPEIFRSPVLKDLAHYIKKKANPRQYISIEPVEEREYHVLSSAQKRLYILRQMDPGSTVYNMPVIMTLLGELDRVKFAGTFKKLIRRHESLRTSFRMLNEEPVQKIHNKVNFEIRYYDIQADSQAPVASLAEIVKNFVRPFDLEKVPLLRVGLIKADAQTHTLMIDMNHIISDGTSIGILANEFMALIAGKDPEPLGIRYRDWTRRQNHEKNSARVKNQEAYWIREFEGKIPVLDLPCDYTRPAVQDFTGKRVTFALSTLETGYLNTLARQEEVTLYMLLLSAYYVLLYKLTDREDIVIGAPTAGRFQVELQKIIGMFLNTLALRNFPGGGKPFKIFLKEVKAKVLNAFANQEYQFDDLVDRLGVKRGGGRNPLFDVMFILQNQGRPEIRIPGLELKTVELEHTTTKFDLSLYAEEVGHELSFSVTFRETLFTRATIAVIIDYFKAILSSVIKDPGQTLADINVIPGERRTAILAQLNQDLENEAGPIMGDGIFQTRLHRSLFKFNDNIAVEYDGSSVSYAELDRGSGVICRWILKRGIPGNTFIGMLINHRLQLIVTLLGIIKAGSVIVPLYPGYPAERLENMIQVTGLRYIFIDKDNARRFKPGPGHLDQGVEFIDPARFAFDAEEEKGSEDHKAAVRYNPGDPLYIHFTSGSTGEPKAILGKNRGLLHFISWEIKTFGINPDFHAAQFTIPGFDPFLRDVFAPLLAGGVVCIPAHEDIIHHSTRLADYVEQRRISLIHCVTGLFRLLISSAPPPTYFRNLAYILLAGEKTNPSDLVEWYDIFGERVQLVNCYGPTETTMSKVYYLIKPRDVNRQRIPVGKPLEGSRVIILDKKRNLCAPLEPGEICIRTPFAGCGYIDAPELNREKFIPNPFADDPGDLIYRSGDLGRVLADGNIDILGRTDRQVKIRGYRVEPGDIEHSLLKHPEIKDAVVLASGDESSDNHLCAYIIPRRPFPLAELREYLAQKLPDYMIPAYFVQMERFPLTARGKIDPNGLPEPVIEVDEHFIAPADETEKKLLKIWSEVLRQDESKISVRANFFELGGHSLKAAVLASKIHKEFHANIPLAEFFKTMTIRGLSRYIRGIEKEQHLDMEPTEKRWFYPLSSAQKRLYFLQMMEGSSSAYNIPRVMKLEGRIQVEKLAKAFVRLIQRHESLRTSFFMVEEEPVQRIHDYTAFEIDKSFAELFQKRLPEGPPEAFIKNFIRPFDLSRAPLLRVGLVKLEEEKHILLVDMHHIVSDGVSIQILIHDFSALYGGKELPEIKLQYKDYAEWQNRERVSKKILEQGIYWKKEYEGEIPVLELPTDYTRPGVQGFEGNRINFELNKETSGALQALALEAGATLYIVLLALYTILLAKLSSREDIIIGSPVAGRRHADLEKIIGMFVGTLALRNWPSAEKKFADFLEEVKGKTLKAFENQEYPYEDLVETVSLARDVSRNPLFDTMFALQNTGSQEIEIPGLKLAPYEFETKTSKFDLSLTGMEAEEKILFTFEYSTKLFKRETLERFIVYFKNLVRSGVESKNRRIFELDILSEEEKRQILFEFNDTERAYPQDKTIHGVFAEQVERTPDHIAVVGHEQTQANTGNSMPMAVTYRGLHEKSDRLAQRLRQKGVESDNIVGIMIERSLEMVIGIFGILKAGGAYLPIDPEYPQERINYMLTDSNAIILLTSREIVNLSSPQAFNHRPKDTSSHLHLPPALATSLAYIIYTSGTTGKPKGAVIEHRSLVNRLNWMQKKYPLSTKDTILQKTTFTFDVSVWEIFWWSMVGAKVCLLLPGGEKDPELITQTVERDNITTMHFVPSMLSAFLDYLQGSGQVKKLSGLKQVIASGEALLPVQVQRFNDLLTRENGAVLANLYGPTEATIDVSYFDCWEGRERDVVPIGKPIDNIRLYILDKQLQIQPVGIPGELCISGIGLARGYLNRPELTRDKFDTFDNRSYKSYRTYISQKLYKTGDLARWLPEGNIEFLGRIDHQVKIRGFRVEPGEIESRLLNYPGIKEVVVLAREEESGDKYICAYVVSVREYGTAELGESLSRELPDYMIPSYFVPLEKIPLTPSGKVDRKALPKPGLKVGASDMAPRNEIETKLAALWSEILGRDALHTSQLQTSLGIDDNFFGLGGHSLKATILAAKIHKLFDVKVPLAEIFKKPTIRGLSDYIVDAAGEKYIRVEPPEEKEYYPLSSAQKRLYFLQVMEESGTGYNMTQVMKLEGKIELDRLEDIFDRLIQGHESFRTSFHIVAEEPVQRIHDYVDFKIECHYLATEGIENTEKEKTIDKSFAELFQKRPLGEPPEASIKNFIRPFDLAQAPLLRAALVKRAEEDFLLMIDMHHIISDGTSIGVLVKEFATLYEGRQLSPLRLHYKDYARWEIHRQEEITRQESYWLREFGEFADEIPLLDLPLDYLRPKVKGFVGSLLSFDLDGNETRALNNLALEQGVTLYMVLLAVYTIFLAKISNQEVIVVGTPTAGRRHADLEQVIGMFVNTLALKNVPCRGKSVHSFLEEVKTNTLNAFANQDYQYEDLVEKVMHHRDASRNPLFDTMFILQNLEIPTLEIPGLKLGPYPYEHNTAKFDLTLICIEIAEHLSCTLEYSTQLFKQETVQRFANYLKKIAAAVPRDPGQQLAKIDMLPEAEKKQLVRDFNDTAVPYPDNKTIYQLFENQVDRFPDHPALIFDNRFLTFRHFDERANRLARYLSTEKGIQPGDRVVVLMERSIELIIVLMAVMKARGAYVPLDVSLPAERLRIVFNDASIGVVVSQRNYFPKIAGVQAECRMLHSILCLEDLRQDIAHYSAARPGSGNAGDTAYVMYTSGSAGIPKGVLVQHRTIVNTITWRKNNYEYAPGYVSLQVPPYFFDSSVTDIFTPLLGGARLVLVRDEERSDLTVLRRIIAIQNVSHFIVVPIFYNVMLEEIAAELKHIKMICCAGDNFPDELIRKHFNRLPQARIFNEYGPTENSVNSTAYELKPHSPRALIGKPIDNVAVYVLDRNQYLTPTGVTGELCLAGSSLAVGYLNSPELTAEKFILPPAAKNPFEKGFLDFPKLLFNHPSPITTHQSPFYRTGDLGRWLPDGNLEFSGRMDNQVKIRGSRVETAEIENRLMKHGDIKEAVVRVRQDESGVNYLCAYIVSQSQKQFSLGPAGLKDYLSQWLPAYMIPSYFFLLEKLPLTPNGKLDINTLPAPQPELADEYITPRNEIEKKLVEIWEAVLGKNNIGINDNFFYIGGDSIKSIQIMSRMNRAGYTLEMKDLFQYPVIAELAPQVKKLRRIPDQAAVTGPVPLTPIQAAFFKANPVDAHHYNQAVMFHAPGGFDKETIKTVFLKIQEHHDALRMTYKINPETGEVMQVNHGPDYPLSLQEDDLKGRENSLEELNEKINRLQGKINLENGPLMKLGLFHLDDGDRLLIVIHHLVIDGVSWRILFEDIAALYEQSAADQKAVLPPKTDSFKLWSEKLEDYAHHKTLLKEKPYWRQLESEIVPPINKDFQAAGNAAKDARNITVNLEEDETALLLNQVNRCYNTEIADILLTALGLAIKKTFGHDRVLISLEGHGRENIDRQIDINRTVGWFTTEYPVLMDVSYAGNTGRQIKEIKETLRKIPNKGIGYGILKYLAREAPGQAMDFKLKPQIIFNYLGQFDAEIRQTSLFQMAKEPTGPSQSLNHQREYELEINGMTANNRLSMTFSYNRTHFRHQTIAALAGHFQSQLKHIIAFCSTKENPERTPSDFTYGELTIERLQQLLDVYPEVEDIYTLSPMQEGMLFHALVDSSSSSYFEQTAFRLQGELDIPLVEKSLNRLVKRHQVLRTAFVHKDTPRPIQVVLKNRPVDFYYRDIKHIIDREEKENVVREFKDNDKKRSFDLSNDILVRASILRLDQSEYEFTWSFHHILMDGWCIGILNNEFFQVYTGYVQDSPHGLPPIKPYRTYIQWLEKQDQEASGLYWENYLDSFAEQTGILNAKRKKEANPPGYSNRQISFELNIEQTKILNKLAARHQVTLNTLTRTIWGILLGKYTGKEDVVFGAVVSGRPFALEGVEAMVGLFINTIPVRLRFHDKMKFPDLLQKVQAEAIAGEAYHYHPLADIQSRGPLKQNLMDHIFVFENYPIAEQIAGYGSDRTKTAASSLTFKLTNVDVFEQTNYDMNVILSGSHRLRTAFQYNGHAIDDDDVKQVARHFRAAFDQVMESRELEVGELTLLSGEEKNRVLYEFNDTAAQYPEDKTIHRLFAEQVEQRPNQVALVGPTSQIPNPKSQTHITYRELNEQSDRLAGLLIEKGVLADHIVGIMMERCLEMVIGIMGILKAGGAYLPMDPDYPQERIDYMLKDSDAKILLTSLEIANLSSPQAFNNGPEGTSSHLNLSLAPVTSLAYTIYTSGTTGKPKGVLIRHGSVVNRLNWMQQMYPLESSDIILQKTPFTFDVSVWELFWWSFYGARLCLLGPGEEKDPGAIIKSIERHHITTMHFVPSMLKVFLAYLESSRESYRCAGLRQVFASGEALGAAHAAEFYRLLREHKDCRVRLINLYGPTEATVDVSYYNCSANHRFDTVTVPIGKPIHNIRLYIVNIDMGLQPIGISGELCIAGVGLARGYLNNPELTAEKYCHLIDKRFFRGSRGAVFSKKAPLVYKTGDLARWLDDGNIEFLGRIDQQVKIRGFRIELGEIENRLKEHPLIKEAVVIDRDDREKQYLCAYIAASQTLGKGMVRVRQLKEHLEGKLPSYMIPACFVEIDKIPLQANGKIHRGMLPQPSESDFHGGDAYQAPVTGMQRTIAAIWQDVLGREKIGIRDNFFDLGGDSLDFIKVSNQLREKLGKEIPVATLFTYATISSLERYLTDAELSGASTTVPGNFVMLNGSPQSVGNIFFIHEILGDVGAYLEFCQRLGHRFNCWGIEAEKLKNYVPQNVTIEEIATKYLRQIKHLQPHGPYNLATWSWGGHLGLEMALQLERMGETLSFLGFVDCAGPDCRKNVSVEAFTLDSEKNFLKSLFTATGSQLELDKIDDPDRLWTTAVDALTADPALVAQLRQLLIVNALALPGYHNLSGEELVQFLNLNRTHAQASPKYTPGGKLHTPIHFFWANQNPGRVESWNDYCHNPVIYHEINGDHHSIFRNKDQIAQFADRFREVIYQTPR